MEWANMPIQRKLIPIQGNAGSAFFPAGLLSTAVMLNGSASPKSKKRIQKKNLKKNPKKNKKNLKEDISNKNRPGKNTTTLLSSLPKNKDYYKRHIKRKKQENKQTRSRNKNHNKMEGIYRVVRIRT
jgi:hypothetical protein